MEVFMFKAALYCAPCGTAIRERLDGEGKRPVDLDNESSFDSDEYPKGPYPDGGGEADSPQHCDACNAFLENALTSDGEEYLAEQIAEVLVHVLKGTRETIEPESAIGQWIAHYGPDVCVRTGYDAEVTIEGSEIVRAS